MSDLSTAECVFSVCIACTTATVVKQKTREISRRELEWNFPKEQLGIRKKSEIIFVFRKNSFENIFERVNLIN